MYTQGAAGLQKYARAPCILRVRPACRSMRAHLVPRAQASLVPRKPIKRLAMLQNITLLETPPNHLLFSQLILYSYSHNMKSHAHQKKAYSNFKVKFKRQFLECSPAVFVKYPPSSSSRRVPPPQTHIQLGRKSRTNTG